MANLLANDPTSQLAAAMSRWDYPFSHEARALADLLDITVAANVDRKKVKKPPTFPRPWPEPKKPGRRSRKPTVSQKQIRAALAARGH